MNRKSEPPRRARTPAPFSVERTDAPTGRPTPSGFRTIAKNKYMTVRYDPMRRVVVLTRSPTPYESLDALQDTFAELEAATADLPRDRSSLLVDSRQAPARNDPAFEAVFSKLRGRFLRLFRRSGLLMQTAVGVLQSTRHAQMDGTDVVVSVDRRVVCAHLEVEISQAELDDLPDRST